MKIIIVRHAQTTENAKTLDIGHDTEALLTEEGIMQAQKLGEFLKIEKISHAYTSPQKRAIHTAEHILKHHPLAKVLHVEDLREQNLGVAESLPKYVWKEMKAKATEAFHMFKAEKGESYAELQQRVKEFFTGLFKKHSHEDTVLLVSHGGTLGVLLLDILGKELTEENYRAHQPKNTEFTIVEIIDEQPRIHILNSKEHLENGEI